MKVKTSITISEKALRGVRRAVGRGGNVSAYVEDAVLQRLVREAALRRDARDLEIIEASAEALGAEAEDVLSYQSEG